MFETRNPAAREWEAWASEGPARRETQHGTLTEWMDVEAVDDRIVRFRANNHFAATGETITEEPSLVFRSRAEIKSDLREAGFDIEMIHGDWTGTPYGAAARLMICIARVR